MLKRILSSILILLLMGIINLPSYATKIDDIEDKAKMHLKAIKQLPNGDPFKQAFMEGKNFLISPLLIDFFYSRTTLGKGNNNPPQKYWNTILERAINSKREYLRTIFALEHDMRSKIIGEYTAKAGAEVMKKTLDYFFAGGNLGDIALGYLKTRIYQAISVTAVGDYSLVKSLRIAIEQDIKSNINDIVQEKLYKIGQFELQNMPKEYWLFGKPIITVKEDSEVIVKVYNKDGEEIQDHMFLLWYSENEDVATVYRGKIIPGEIKGKTLVHVFEYGSPYEKVFKIKVE